MTLAEINNIADLFAKAGSRIPVAPAEWREMQIIKLEKENPLATKSIGKATLKNGKVRPVVKQSASQKAAGAKKAARVVKGLKANVASSKANRERAKR